MVRTGFKRRGQAANVPVRSQPARRLFATRTTTSRCFSAARSRTREYTLFFSDAGAFRMKSENGVEGTVFFLKKLINSTLFLTEPLSQARPIVSFRHVIVNLLNSSLIQPTGCIVRLHQKVDLDIGTEFSL